MAKDPNFTSSAHIGAVVASVANTNRDGTGTLASVFVAPAAGGALAGGSRIERIRATALGSTTDGMLRFFIDTGAARFLYREVEVQALVPSAVIPPFAVEIECKDLALPAGWTLKVGTHNAESFSVLAFGGDF